MLIKVKRGWELPERAATDESAYLNRRAILKTMGLGGLSAAAMSAGLANRGWASTGLYPAERNPKYKVPERPLSAEKDATTYNNFYEFGTSKNVVDAARKMAVDPWTVEVDGLVGNPMTLDFDALEKKIGLEERVYRHRCVEAWAMTVPWTGFPLAKLVAMAEPKPDAKYISMQTLADEATMPTLQQRWYPWPYTEGLTIEEATNELAFIATGLYGKRLPNQNGAPIRLVVPWKYGFKSIKSIVRITFTDKRPVSFWEELQGSEYGFWANVNPEVPHPRWSQASEKLLTVGERVPTKLYNGYAEYVAHLYDGLEEKHGDRLFR